MSCNYKLAQVAGTTHTGGLHITLITSPKPSPQLAKEGQKLQLLQLFGPSGMHPQHHQQCNPCRLKKPALLNCTCCSLPDRQPLTYCQPSASHSKSASIWQSHRCLRPHCHGSSRCFTRKWLATTRTRLWHQPMLHSWRMPGGGVLSQGTAGGGRTGVGGIARHSMTQVGRKKAVQQGMGRHNACATNSWAAHTQHPTL